MNIQPLILWGATGQSIMLEEILRNNFSLKALFDNNPNVESPFQNVPIHHGWNAFLNWGKQKELSKFSFMVAIGGEHGEVRLELHHKLKEIGLKSISAIHTSSYVSEDAIIGEGIQVLPNATINPRVKVGKCCIINTSAAVDHECILGDGVHIGPGAKLAGCIHVGDFSFIGTNATILPNLKIGKNAIIGAGSVVTKDIPDNCVAYGNPHRIVKRKRK
jgi:sugar O-acyltransferase (sialic acid O-acetyltransferase NeuD family)